MPLELAIGDAYGAGFEYANELVEKHNDLSGYIQHPRHKATRPGMYTDDTQMSIAIAELIVSGAEWTPLIIANHFVECFKRDERGGYAGGFQDFLQSIGSGQDFLDKIRPDSDKSGAAMRAAPIGIYPTVEQVLKKAETQAKLTHNTPDGIQAAQAAALMAHYFLYDCGAKLEVGAWLEQHIQSSHRWNEPYKGKVKSKGWMSVQAAITAVMRNASMSDLLKDCIAFKGDVDTVATIALGAAAHSKEVTQDIPQHLIDTLENGTYGRDYLMQLDKKLLDLVAV
jgi:ADP-ribosyl-[dinitrogen reductase] hydrolase